MVGTKGKSGGKRNGSGHPSLIEQFEKFINPLLNKYGDDFSIDVSDEQEAQAIDMYKKIVSRKEKIEQELAEIEVFLKSSNSAGAARSASRRRG